MLGEAVADGLGAFADQMTAIREREEATRSTEQLAEFQSRWNTQLDERARQSEPGAPNFAGQFLKDYDTDMAAAIAGAQTADSRRFMRERLAAFRGQLNEGAIRFEAGSRIKHIDDVAEKADDAARSELQQHPERYADRLAERRALNGAQATSPVHLQARNDASRKLLSRDAVIGIIEKNPQAAIKALDADVGNSGIPAVDHLDADDRLQLRNAAESEIARREAAARALAAEARQKVSTGFSDAIAAKSYGLPATMPSREVYRAAYGEDGNKRFALDSQMFQIYDVVGSAVGLPPEQAAARIKAYAPKSQAGAADQAKVFESAVALYQQQRKAFEADPAGGVLLRDPQAAQLFQAAVAEDADQADIDAYVSKATSVQQAAGISAPAILPEAAAEAIGQQLQPNPAKPGQRAIRLAQLEQTWGRHYGDVLRQVAPKLDGIGQILPFVPARTAARLDALSADPKPVLETLQQSGRKTDMEQAVTNELEDFDRTMPAGVVMDGAAVSQQYRDAITLYAADLARGGASPAKAARQAYQEIIGSQYETRGTLRIPRREDGGRGREVDTDAVATGADFEKMNLYKAGQFGVTANQWEKPEDAQADMRELVRKEGFWIASGDEAAAVLALPTGVVLGADGRPITRTWAQLEAAAVEKRRQVDTAAAENAATLDRNIR